MLLFFTFATIKRMNNNIANMRATLANKSFLCATNKTQIRAQIGEINAWEKIFIKLNERNEGFVG
jgi:hypothetical protein